MRTAAISKGGQISVPATVRHRWGTEHVRIVDHGDWLVIEPMERDPIAHVRGSLPLPDGLTSDSLRSAGRADDEVAEARRG